jgi:hypothetical protein
MSAVALEDARWRVAKLVSEDFESIDSSHSGVSMPLELTVGRICIASVVRDDHCDNVPQAIEP